jgi:hypothetical protein
VNKEEEEVEEALVKTVNLSGRWFVQLEAKTLRLILTSAFNDFWTRLPVTEQGAMRRHSVVRRILELWAPS